MRLPVGSLAEESYPLAPPARHYLVQGVRGIEACGAGA
jgi:hypothetical protein